MKQRLSNLWSDKRAAVAPTVALSLFVLIGMGGIAFDYARVATLDTELQNAADQAALAAATQLDQQPGAVHRAVAAAQGLLVNQTLMANDNNASNMSVTVPTVLFYTTKAHAEADNGTACPTANAIDPATVPTNNADPTAIAANTTARFVCVRTADRVARYALTPVVAAFSSGNIAAMAVAGVGSAICKVPPVMICNPDEPVGNVDELLDFNPSRGTGLRLVTGNASVPGNFGWLEAGLGNGTQALAGELGYNVPLGECQGITGVTTKTGMDTAVLDAFNTRFDVYANGNTTCPSQGGGTCSPSVNTRKDLTCEVKDGACKNDTWTPVIYDPYWDSDADGDSELAPLPTTASALDPPIMGYPHDICHSSLQSRHTCGIKGSGVWDVNAYFRINYGLNESGWRTMLGMTGTTAIPARYDVYLWEIDHKNGTGTKGINFYQPLPSPSKEAAFSIPATGRAGVAQGGSQPDRRTIAVAVLNCRALNVHGKTTNVPVPSWLKVFLVEPAIRRGTGSDLYADSKDVYVEFIEKSAHNDDFEEVIRRDVPYLVK